MAGREANLPGWNETLPTRNETLPGGNAMFHSRDETLPGGNETLAAANEKLPPREAMILETAVGRACWCVWAGVWREATTRQAHACKAERQSQAHVQACQRACSAVTLWVSVGEGTKACAHTTLEVTESSQLPFLG